MIKFKIILLVLVTCTAFGQNHLPKGMALKVDSLLIQYEGKRPGYAIGIVQNGELTFSKGYGQANLDYQIPISDTTAFYIGSMAKQFTAAALLILEAEGKLNFKKPITTYLPEFPIYKDEITIEHLIHHTSGIRETNSLQLFQGIDLKFEEVFHTDDLYNLITAQNHLNFKPGSEYRYSSGGYAVLAKIIEKVSGMTLRDFLYKRVFAPLGMIDTVVYDNHNEVVENRAVSYWPIENENYERRSQVFDAYGDGGIITTVRDLAKWDDAFYEDRLEVENFADKMYQKGVLNDQSEIDYARGLNVWEYKGQKVVQHNGGMLGFRVDLVRFPETRTSIILLGNSAYLNPTWDALKIAEILNKDTFQEQLVVEEGLERTLSKINIPTNISEERAGYYWTDQTNYYRRISYMNDSLFIDDGSLSRKRYLIPVSQNEYVQQGTNAKTRLYFNSNQKKKTLLMKSGNVKRDFRKFDAAPPQQVNELAPYIGIYESEELNTIYKFYENNDKLYLQINNNKALQVYPVEADSNVVWNGKEMLWIGFGEIKFSFNDQVEVYGFNIGDQRVSGVSFKKIKSIVNK